MALLLLFEQRAEDARQIADVLRDQEIVLHEPLDAAAAGVVGVAHALRDLALQVEGQPVLGAVRRGNADGSARSRENSARGRSAAPRPPTARLRSTSIATLSTR